MDKIFLDANILFSAAYRSDAGLKKLWGLKVRLVTSDYAVEEARINLSTREQQDRLELLIEKMEIVATPLDSILPEDIQLPEKDIPILGAAVAASATHLLTGDIAHFGKYFGKKILGVLILPPGKYFNMKK